MENNDRSRRLSWLLMPGLLVFAFALLCKWNKWPGGTLLLITSGVITWIGVLVLLYARGRGAAGVLGTATAMCVTYVVFRLMYWPGGILVGASTLVLAAWTFVLWRRNERSNARVPALLGVVLLCTIGLMAVPVHALYHYMFFETPGARRFIHSGTGHWYRYSWLLYEDGQYAHSAAMIDSAMAEVVMYKARTGKDGEWLLAQLRQVRTRIDAREWDTFQPLRSPREAVP